MFDIICKDLKDHRNIGAVFFFFGISIGLYLAAFFANKRKKQFQERIHKLINFATIETCRAEYIGNYFGDEEIKPCGVCDNCLQSKKKELTASEFGKIQEKITNTLKEYNQTIDQLNGKIDIPKDQLLLVLEEMKREQLVDIGIDGSIYLT